MQDGDPRSANSNDAISMTYLR